MQRLDRARVTLLEDKVTDGPPDEVLPPVHHFTGARSGKQGSTQHTLNVATMAQKSDNAWKTCRDLMRVTVSPPPGLDPDAFWARATQGHEGGGTDGGSGDGIEEGYAAQGAQDTLSAGGGGGTRATQGAEDD